jgi:hypothetical protein
MTDFALLLKDAAGQPPRPLNMAAIRQRATTLGLRRRISLWTWAVLATLGIGGATGATLATIGHQPSDVRTIHGERDTPDGPVHPDRNSGSAVAFTPDNRSAPGGLSSTPVSSIVAVPRTHGPDTTTTTGASEYARAATCSVDTVGESVRTCRFTATAAGGWNMYFVDPVNGNFNSNAHAEVRVTRDGKTTTYKTHEEQWDPVDPADRRPAGCADNVVQPGDQVEVIVYAPAGDWLQNGQDSNRPDIGAGAGQDWGCTNGTHQ